MSPQTFTFQHRVTYAECTVGNHVYYGRFLEILEAARGEFFRHLGQPFLTWQNEQIGFPVVECNLRYHGMAQYDDLLAIEIWISRLERVRFGFGYRVRNQAGREILTAETIHACTNLAGKPQRLPETLRSSLEPFLRPPN